MTIFDFDPNDVEQLFDSKAKKKLTDSGYSPAALTVIHKFLTMKGDERDGRGCRVYDNPDNLRIARLSSEEEARAYRKAATDGCCGSVDETIETPDGPAMVGFNYGH